MAPVFVYCYIGRSDEVPEWIFIGTFVLTFHMLKHYSFLEQQSQNIVICSVALSATVEYNICVQHIFMGISPIE